MPQPESPLTTSALEKRREAIRGMFNRIAPTYDLLNRMLSLGVDRRWRRLAVAEMQIGTRSVVLDLACGTGDLMLEAAACGALTVIGVDPAAEMLLRARSKLRHLPVHCYLLEAYGEELPLRQGVCSHAMVAFGLRNVAERTRVLAELFRVLRQNGTLLLLEFTPLDKKFFATLFNLYFHKLLPRIGGWISRDRPAYDYLPQSVARFVTADELIREAESVGFTFIKRRRFFFGVATALFFRKSHR